MNTRRSKHVSMKPCQHVLQTHFLCYGNAYPANKPCIVIPARILSHQSFHHRTIHSASSLPFSSTNGSFRLNIRALCVWRISILAPARSPILTHPPHRSGYFCTVVDAEVRPASYLPSCREVIFCAHREGRVTSTPLHERHCITIRAEIVGSAPVFKIRPPHSGFRASREPANCDGGESYMQSGGETIVCVARTGRKRLLQGGNTAAALRRKQYHCCIDMADSAFAAGGSGSDA
jgi:hypothetical protein